jgi:hypothetical protein
MKKIVFFLFLFQIFNNNFVFDEIKDQNIATNITISAISKFLCSSIFIQKRKYFKN